MQSKGDLRHDSWLITHKKKTQYPILRVFTRLGGTIASKLHILGRKLWLDRRTLLQCNGIR